MTTEEMRNRLADAYMSQNWKDKVKRMGNSQVFVVYSKFKNEGKVK